NAPYRLTPVRQIFSIWFIITENDKKMSKSLGNSLEPEDVIKQSGADIIRLWVSMSDYTQEIRLSGEILARAVEAYRKIRNTMRYLLANLYDFDPLLTRADFGLPEKANRNISPPYPDVARQA